MSDKTSLGDRMKKYESATAQIILPRTPVIIRVDGKAFHTFTKKLNEKIDPSVLTGPSVLMHHTMACTAQMLNLYIQNAVFTYTQSDEISILVCDYEKHETQQWFAGKIQKMCSIASAMATAYFNFYWEQHLKLQPEWINDLALFDARVFNLPKEEVTNYFIWRQQDATRNSVNFLGQLHFPHKELQGKSVSDVQEMLFQRKQINWNDCDTWKKRGSCTYRNPDTYDSSGPIIIDDNIPIFTEARNYVEKFVNVEQK